MKQATEIKDQVLFIPIQKVDMVKREVWGRGAHEILDGADEIMDYASSKPLFQKWSEDAYRRSGGKSKGNLRAMHKTIAAGKLIDINFNDQDKAIDIGAFVADDEEWGKVMQGVYTGFSVGGSYAKRWFDPGGGIRYTAKPSEISLVDAPCIQTAVFQLIKEDGTTELRKFAGATVEKIAAPVAPGGADVIASGESEARVLIGEQGDDQAAANISASHGIEPAGVKSTTDPANPPGWLDEFQAVVREFSAGVDKLDQVRKAETADRDQVLNELTARGTRVGIARREGEPMTPPAVAPQDPAAYADPANWQYPCFSKIAGETAVDQFNKGSSRSKYNPREWNVLGRRIASIVSKSAGTTYVFSAEEKLINKKKEGTKMEIKLAKGTDVGSLLADVKAAMNGAVEAIQSDPQKAQDLLMQALSAVDVATDVAKPATLEENPHGPTDDAKVDTMKAAAPTPGAGPDKPQTPSTSSTPQTPQASTTGESEYEQCQKQILELTGLVKALAQSLKKDESPVAVEAVPATHAAPVEIKAPEEKLVAKNLPAGDLQAIVGNGSDDSDLAKMLTSDPITGLKKAIEKTGKTPAQLQNAAQELFIKALVDDGRISVRSHQIYNPPL